jgi:anti-sigma B factor antagonist
MDGEPPFRLEQQNLDGRRRVAVAGEIDMLTAPALEEALSEACTLRATIELDLHEVSFIDSTGIRAILTAKAACAENDVELLMVPSRHAAPHRVFELSGLLDRLPWRTRRD